MKGKGIASWLLAAGLLAGAAEPATDGRELEKGTRLEVRHSMTGPRDTLLFYTFADEQAVLRLQIEKHGEDCSVSGTVYLFDRGTAPEGLERWINNQHSDGLFPEVPEPVLASRLAADACTAIPQKIVKEGEQAPSGERFRDWQVKVSVKACRVDGEFALVAFTDTAGVFEKME